MNTKHLFAVGAVTCALGLSGLMAAEKSAGNADANFIKKAADANMTEIEAGKLAGDHAQSQAVKDFGERMVKDHGKAGDDLKPIAEKLKVDVPSEVTNAKHKETIATLTKLNGDAFDKKFSAGMKQDHAKVIAMFESAKGEVKDPDLKKFIENTLPTLKEHAEMAKKLPSGK